MALKPKEVVIIGAGVSGLASIKSCVEEGLHPICFEQNDYIGGLWHYVDELKENQGAVVYDTLITNTSKWMTNFSDFPFPEEIQSYPSHEDMKIYLENYAKAFNLHSYIRFNHVVVDIKILDINDKDNKWKVTVRNKDKDSSEEITCSNVIICNGRQRLPYYPNIDGIKDFNGQVLHSLHYRNSKCLRNKSVLVVGNANSATDIATEACSQAKSVCLSTGRGTWITQRHGPEGTGLPLDFKLKRFLKWIPISIVNLLLKITANRNIDHQAHHITTESNRGPLYSSFVVNDKMTELIRNGYLVMKPHLIKLEGNRALFSDQTYLEGIDLIIIATGYKLEWDFLNHQGKSDTNASSSVCLPSDWSDLNLYRLVWPEDSRLQNLALVGVAAVRGPVVPVLELQSRWVAGVFNGRLHLPSQKIMKKEIAERKEAIVQRYGYLKVAADSLAYQDELVQELGLKPSFLSMLLQSPKDTWRWYFGPLFPYLHRWYGAHSWSGAREAVDDAWTDAKRKQNELIRNHSHTD